MVFAAAALFWHLRLRHGKKYRLVYVLSPCHNQQNKMFAVVYLFTLHHQLIHSNFGQVPAIMWVGWGIFPHYFPRGTLPSIPNHIPQAFLRKIQKSFSVATASEIVQNKLLSNTLSWVRLYTKLILDLFLKKKINLRKSDIVFFPFFNKNDSANKLNYDKIPLMFENSNWFLTQFSDNS